MTSMTDSYVLYPFSDLIALQKNLRIVASLVSCMTNVGYRTSEFDLQFDCAPA